MATKGTWKRRIKAACDEAGTYEPFFDLTIEQLAGILETRDAAQKQFKESGGAPVVTHVNKGGFENVVKNPALAVINECNQQALSYWKELGLTSKAYAQMQKAGAGVKKKEATFEDLLSGIGI